MFGPSPARQPSPFGPVRLLGTTDSTGGVAGVSVLPTSTFQPPAAPGGPHLLPNLPQFPLPQDIPNPFEIQQLIVPAQAPTLPLGSGITYTIGPNNQAPGSTTHGFGQYPPRQHGGQFPASTAGAPGFPAALAPTPTVPQWPVLPQSPLTEWPKQPEMTMPQWQMPSVAQTPAPTAIPSTQVQRSPDVSGFWLNLGWQLLLTPSGRKALGDRYSALMEGPTRERTLKLASECLVRESLQTAYRDLTSGMIMQNQFIDQFSAEVEEAVRNIEV